MTLILTEATQRNDILNAFVTGKLTSNDYEQLGPRVSKMAEQHGKARLLIELQAFDGWTAGALWEDLKFDARHFNDIERIAIVGEPRWEQEMARLYKPFTRAAVRYFPSEELAQANLWLNED